MSTNDQEKLDNEWKHLCQDLEAARQDYEAADALVVDSCGAAPRKGGEATGTNDALLTSIEANLRKIDVLKRMRLFISKLDP